MSRLILRAEDNGRSGASQRPVHALLALAALIPPILFGGCGGDGTEVGDDVASVDGRTVTRSELDLYLTLNLPPTDEDPTLDSGGADRVKSRLLDALVAEAALVSEAMRRGLAVSEEEIDAYLQVDGEDAPAVKSLSDALRRRLARQRMLAQKLRESLVEEMPPPDDEEVLAYIERSGGRLAPRKRIRLRSLRLESAETAQEVAARIRAGRLSFVEAVVNYETNPGQGVLLELSWDNLSPEIRESLEGLDPGEVSLPVEFNGDIFLFQVDSWLTKPGEMDQELIRRARNELAGLRMRQASEALLDDLQDRMSILIHEERLPFDYIR